MTASREELDLACSTAFTGQLEGQAGAGARARRKGLAYGPRADSDAPFAAAHQPEHHVDDRGGVVHHALHLVAGGPLEGAQHARPGRQPAQDLLDPVVAASAVALVDRQHEHVRAPPETTVKAQPFTCQS
jgi:hypothetical protein